MEQRTAAALSTFAGSILPLFYAASLIPPQHTLTTGSAISSCILSSTAAAVAERLKRDCWCAAVVLATDPRRVLLSRVQPGIW